MSLINRSLVQRASGSLSLKALPALYGAALILLVVRVLPLGDFGRYGMTIAYVNLVAGLARGLWTTPLVIRAARGDRRSFHGPALWLSLATALTGAALAQIILPLLGVGRELALLAAAMQISLVPRDVALAFLQAGQRAWAAFWVEAGYFIGSLVGFLVLTTMGLLTTAEVTLAVNFGASVLSALIGLAYEPGLLSGGFHGDWKGIFRLGRWIGLLGLGEIFFQQGDALLVGAFFSAETVAPYIAARTLLRLYGLFSQAVNFFVLPGASRLLAEGLLERLRRKIRFVLGIMLAILVPLNIAMWFISPILFPLVLGAKYIPAIPFFRVLLLATFLEPVYSVRMNAITGMAFAHKLVPWIAAAIATDVVINMVGLPWFGIWVAPIALVFTYGVLALSASLLERQIARGFDS